MISPEVAAQYLRQNGVHAEALPDDDDEYDQDILLTDDYRVQCTSDGWFLPYSFKDDALQYFKEARSLPELLVSVRAMLESK